LAATTEVVYTAAQTTAMMDDTLRNPVRTDKRGEVHITLVFDGVSIDPAAINDAIQTLGTVQCDKIPQGGNYSFIIT
jgi:hypothetical protein